MRPYLAVIVDSFRAAMSSWVLYIMLILISGILLAIAAIGYKEELTTSLGPREVLDPFSLMERLQKAGADERPSLEKRIWEQLDEPMRKEFAALPQKIETASRSESELRRAIFDAQGLFGRLADKLDAMLDDEDFFDESLWSKVELDPEAGELIQKGLRLLPEDEWAGAAKDAGATGALAGLNRSEITYQQWRKLAWKAEVKEKLFGQAKARLSHEELGRLNRLALDAAFPGMISASPSTSMRFYWATIDLGDSIPMRRQELSDRIAAELPWYVDNFVLSIGMIVAIVVTAPIVPQMFEPGSLNLLLSKPVTRWMLFLSKFVGGCAFTLLCAAYLFGGAWLLLGLRLGIWQFGMLMSIPIYVFVFAIYFTVSAIAGVIWRNSIVSVIVTVFFWGACWLIGMTAGFMESVNSLFQIARLAPAGDEFPLYVDSAQRVYAWNKREGAWGETLVERDGRPRPIDFQARLLGPIYDAERQQFAAIEIDASRRGMLIVAREEEAWAPREVAEAPLLADQLLREPGGDLLVLTLLGELYRVPGDPLALQREIERAGKEAPSAAAAEGGADAKGADEKANNDKASDDKAADGAASDDASQDAANALRAALAAQLNVFRPAGPREPIAPQRPFAIAAHPSKRTLATYIRGVLAIYAADEAGVYALAKTGKKLKGNETLPAILAFAGETLVVARGDGKVLLVDGDRLTLAHEFAPAAEGLPLAVAASSDGRRAAVLFQDKTLYLIDVAAGKLEKAAVEGQGEIAAVAFSERGRLWVASGEQSAVEYVLGKELSEPLEADRRIAPGYNLRQKAYHYFVKPLYFISPKPGKFDQTVQYLLLDSDSGETATGAEARELRAKLDPWSPVLSGAVFMVVMLGLACLYIERQDF